jgi:hypothetical protein
MASPWGYVVPFSHCRLPSACKRLAVPFRAADTPSERTEYAQPEVALVLTFLSYYYDGLTRDELRAALEQLMGMGLNAQEEIYNDWLQLSQQSITEGMLRRASTGATCPLNLTRAAGKICVASMLIRGCFNYSNKACMHVCMYCLS